MVSVYKYWSNRPGSQWVSMLMYKIWTLNGIDRYPREDIEYAQ